MADYGNTDGPVLATWHDVSTTFLPGNRRRVFVGATALFDVATGDVLREIAVRLQVLADEWQDLTLEEAERRRWIIHWDQTHRTTPQTM